METCEGCGSWRHVRGVVMETCEGCGHGDM